MEIVQSNKGGRKVLFDGFMYVKQKTSSTGNIRWVCFQRKTKFCNGSITTNADLDLVCSYIEHSHAPDLGEIEATKCRNKMKQRAITSHDNPSVIFGEEVNKLSEEGRISIAKEETAKRFIRQNRRRKFPKEPAHLDQLTVLGEWTTTGGTNPQPFLIYDNKDDPRPRCMIFASKQCLRVLERSQAWHMDGNFSLAPKNFQQVYVIHATIDNGVFPVVYALITQKSKEAYMEVFQALATYCDSENVFLDPREIVLDFELAAMQAFQEVFGLHITVRACYFHLCQNTWKKIQELGLVTLYRTNEEVRHFVGMIDGLAFLPVEEVQEGLEHLKRIMPDDLMDLLYYFDSTYVSGSFRRVGAQQQQDQLILRARRRPPIYPPRLWNVHELTLQDASRTNNFSEAWNSRIKKMVGGNHPSIWRLIDALQTDTAAAETAITQHEVGQPVSKRQKNKLR